MSLLKKNGGFTLVELIVVIAILAILAGVAVPAYSGYVEKANKQADITMAKEAAHALTLNYYNKYDENTNGYVMLNPNNQAATYDAVGKAAMDAVFGEGWETTMSLKYDGWKSTGVGGSIAGSSFAGKEKELMNTVNELSGTLSNFLKDYEGSADGFFPYLEKLGIDKSSDPTAAANAAVLYVSDAVKKANQENISNVLTSVPNKIVSQMNEGKTPDTNTIMMETAVALQGELGGSTMAAAAVMYAYAESYAMATGQTLTIDAAKITDGKTGLAEVQNAFAGLMDMGSMTPEQMNSMITWGGITQDPDSLNYILGDGAAYQKDAQAVMSAMGAVNNASDLLKDKLSQENLFADAETQDMVISYLNASATGKDGSFMIMIQNGVVVTDPELPKE